MAYSGGMNELIEQLDTILDELTCEPLTSDQIESLSARIHKVWQALADRPWVTTARLDLSAAVAMLDGQGSDAGRPWQVLDVAECVGRAILTLRRVVARGMA